MLETTYDDTQRQLDNLTKMRYRDLIDDETFSREREALQKELTRTNQRLNETYDWQVPHFLDTSSMLT